MKQVITLICIALGATSFAQEKDSLSMEEAILRTLNNNYQIQISGKSIDIAKLRNSWGEAGRWPTVDFSFSNNYSFIDNTNNPAAFPPSELFSISLNPSLSFNWVLFNGMGIHFSKINLAQLEEQSIGNAQVVIENTIHSVMLTYYNALVQQEKIDIMRKILSVSQEKLAYYEKKQELGVGTSLDALQFKNQMLTDSTILLNYKITYDNLKRNLSILMGDTTFAEYILTSSLDIEIPTYSYEELYSMTMDNNQTIKNQYISLALQETNIKTAQSFLYPSVSVNGGANINSGWVNFITQNQSTTTFSPNYFGGLNIRYAIFNNGRNKRNVDVARIQLELQELQLDEVKLAVRNDLRTQFANYQNQKVLLAVSQENVQYAVKVYEVGEKRYEASAISYFQLNDYRNSLRNALLADLDNKYTLIQTYLDIFRSTGGILQRYSK